MGVSTPVASPSPNPVPSTLPMSPDRSIAGKLVGELYFAATTLVEGRNANADAVRHEIRVLTSSGTSGNGNENRLDPSNPAAGHSGGGASSSHPASPSGPSLTEWKKLVAQLLLATQQLPNAVGCLPNGLKRDMASAIRLGKQLCGGGSKAASEAMKRLEKASELYRKLSGPSHL